MVSACLLVLSKVHARKNNVGSSPLGAVQVVNGKSGSPWDQKFGWNLSILLGGQRSIGDHKSQTKGAESRSVCRSLQRAALQEYLIATTLPARPREVPFQLLAPWRPS